MKYLKNKGTRSVFRYSVWNSYSSQIHWKASVPVRNALRSAEVTRIINLLSDLLRGDL